MGERNDVRHQNNTVSVHGADGKVETNYSTKGKNDIPLPRPQS